MAAETEGIALLSMYGDDEEDEEHLPQLSPDKSPQPPIPPSPAHPIDGAEIKALRSPFPSRTPTPQPQTSQSQFSSPFILTSPSPSPATVFPPAVQEYPDGQRSGNSALAIVDYAHDETTMSPETEVMETETNGRVVFGAELLVSDGNIKGTIPGTSWPLTPPSHQELLPSLDAFEQSKTEGSTAMEFTGTELDVAVISSTVSTYIEINKPMQNFLPPPLTSKCPEELQEKINKFLAYKRAGKSFNADLRNRKDYRNPNFLQHAVSFQDIDEIGTCFSKEVFDPHGYDKSDYYDEIEADLKREVERKEQERKKSQKIDFVPGSTQPGVVAPALKTNSNISAAGGSSLLSSSLPPNPAAGDSARDIRTNKKSKWDKVDGDPIIQLPSDNPHTVSVHASHLSSANAGTGYSAFAQLKRREAEERKLGQRKYDKRS